MRPLLMTVDDANKPSFEKKLFEMHMMSQVLGWRFVDKFLFLPEIKRGRKRLKLKKAKQMRLHWIGQELRAAGMRVVVPGQEAG